MDIDENVNVTQPYHLVRCYIKHISYLGWLPHSGQGTHSSVGKNKVIDTDLCRHNAAATNLMNQPIHKEEPSYNTPKLVRGYQPPCTSL